MMRYGYQYFPGFEFPAQSVAYADIQNVDANRILGNPTGSPAAMSEISLGGDLEFSGTSIQGKAFTGDVTRSAGGTALTIASEAVTFSKFQNINTNRLLGRYTALSGSVEEVQLGSTLGFTAGNIDVLPSTSRQLTKVILNGVDIGSRSQVHYSDNTDVGIKWNVTDDAGNSEIDVTFDKGGYSVVGNVTADNLLASTTSYWGIYGGQVTDNTNENNRLVYWPVKGEFSRFYVRTYTAQSGTGSLVLYVRINGADYCTVTIAAGSAAGSYSNTVNTGAVNAGETVSIKGVNNATANSSTLGWAVAFRASA